MSMEDLRTVTRALDGLRLYRDTVDSGKIESYEDYLEVATDPSIRLASSIADIVFIDGKPSTYDARYYNVIGRTAGWKVTASTAHTDFPAVHVNRQHRNLVGRKSAESLVLFPDSPGHGSVIDTEHRAHNIEWCKPNFWRIDTPMAHVPGHVWYGDSPEAHLTPSLAEIATQAEQDAPNTLAAFLRISRNAVASLVDISV